MKIREAIIIISVLKKELRLSLLQFLFKCQVKKGKIFRQTHWMAVKGRESGFVKRLSFACAVYAELGEIIGKERAFEIMRRILVPIGCNEQWGHLNSLRLSEDTGMVRLMAFNNLMDKKGATLFNHREYIKQNKGICHFVITRCVFYDFFTEVGMPELTTLFCEVDKEFFPGAFPEFRFYRGDSWENTVAYGADHCNFIFEKK